MATESEQKAAESHQETAKPQPQARVQRFCDKNKTILPGTVEAHQIGREYYVYWADIQQKFNNIDHLEKYLDLRDNTVTRGPRVLYETDGLHRL